MKMGLFACRGCAAKDEEIKHLLWELDKLHASLQKTVDRAVEVQSPGAVARAERGALLANDSAKATPKLPRRRVQTLPGYEPEFQDEVEVT
jgi:hypothetical protein